LTAGSATPNVGDEITFTITVTNNGPGAATGVTLTDLLPAGLTYVESSVSGGTYDDDTGIWSGFALADAAQATLTITAIVDADTEGDTITNTTTAATSDLDDPTTSGDDLEESVTVNTDVVAVN